MARKDDILKSFLEHDLIKSKYNVEADELPGTVREAFSIGILESPEAVRDNDLRNLITQYLNQTAI